MLHSTTTTPQPSQKSLLFITTFARVYNSQAHNEPQARSIAQEAANNITDKSYKQLSWARDSKLQFVGHSGRGLEARDVSRFSAN